MVENTKFLKKVYQALQSMDEYAFDTYEQAISNILDTLSSDLTNLVTIHNRFTFEAVASITSLTEKRLESNNQEFLNRLKQYVAGVDRAFEKHSINLAKAASKRNIRLVTSDEKQRQKEILLDIIKHKKTFATAIKKVNELSQKRMEEAKRRKLTQLKNYQYEFKQLNLFQTLDIDEAITLLAEKAKVVAD